MVLDHLLAELRDTQGVFGHFRGHDRLEGLGLLKDQAWMARSIISAYCATLDAKYLQAAEQLGDYILAELIAADGSFLIAPVGERDVARTVIPPPRRSWEDTASRSAASVAAEVLMDLGTLTGQEQYTATGQKALASLTGAVDKSWGTFLGGYALAVDKALGNPPNVIIIASEDTKLTAALLETARRHCRPGGLVLAVDPQVPAQAEQLARLGHAAQAKPVAYVCRGRACLPPAYTVEQLLERLQRLAEQAGS